ncbi:hypothetical protein [Pseudonocardia dioxanivorans]|uniref:hypothetical protein n=1 Tax=Pseudonocardia dioxanivorans TaxID=240495 RepID=UPI000CD26726|nr:hypothetical protein [Pseudonocardia dioxanivorans]
MPEPFLSYLRVYEPLRVFDGPTGVPVREALRRGAVEPHDAGRRDRDQCLRAALRSRLLPGDDGAGGELDVVVTTSEAGDRLVCPLDTRPRAAAAVLAFLAEELPVLRAAALPVAEAAARRGAEAALTEIGDGAAHVVTSAWTVPLPWFALVDPARRRLRLDSPRRVHWQVLIGTAIARAERAEKIVRSGIGDEGPAEVLAETAGWLGRFDRESVVELDYGGLVEFIDDDTLRADDSARLVQDALQALHDGDGDTAQACYERLREFWGAVAGRRRNG